MGYATRDHDLLEGAQPLEPEMTVEWIPALRAFARSLTRDEAAADDLVQDTLVKAIRHKHRFRAGSNLRAWLFTIMRNTFYTSLKKNARESTGDTECISSRPSVPATQEWSVRGQEVWAAVNRLPDHYREMLILVVMLGESYETSAQICNVAIGTVKSRVNRARTMIMEDMGDSSL